MSVLSLPKIQLQKLSIGKRDIIQSKISHFTVKYGDQQDIVIHTPKLLFQTVPTPSKSNGFHQLTLCFYNYDCSQETRDFVDKCVQLEDYVYQQTKHRIPSSEPFTEPTFQPSIVFNPTKTKAYMFVSLKSDVSTVFDTKRQKQSPDYVVAQSSGYCILYLHSLWNHNSQKWGFNWTCLQAKVYHPYPTLHSYMIQDPDEESPDNHYWEPTTSPPPTQPLKEPSTSTASTHTPVAIDESHPTYGKFIKMKRVGLPEPVIRLKCQQEGYNWDDVMKLSSSTPSPSVVSTSVPSSTPPPSLPIGPPMGIGRGGPLFTSDMFAKVSLKKAEPAKSSAPIMGAGAGNKTSVQHLKKLNNGFQPPSLHDIQSMLSKLKSNRPPLVEASS